MKRKFIVLILSLSVIGCASWETPKDWEGPYSPEIVKLYPDDKLTYEQISRIRIVNVGNFVTEINGQSMKPFSNPIKGTYKTEAHLRPGNQSLNVEHTRNIKNRTTYIEYEKASGELVFDSKANRLYTVIIEDTGDKTIRFRVEEHGPEYDRNCSDVFSRQKVRDPIYQVTYGNDIPPECY